MDEPVARLAAYFRTRTRLPDEELARLTLAARAAGRRWEAIAAACGITTCKDLAGVIYRITGHTGAELLFSATQDAVRQLTASERRYPPLTWACSGCGQQVTDRAPVGRPVHVEHGHAFVRVPLDANISAFEFEDLTDFTRDRAARPTRIPLTIPAPRATG
jgi:hypothetical protein